LVAGRGAESHSGMGAGHGAERAPLAAGRGARTFLAPVVLVGHCQRLGLVSWQRTFYKLEFGWYGVLGALGFGNDNWRLFRILASVNTTVSDGLTQPMMADHQRIKWWARVWRGDEWRQGLHE
jgi:hypothetical protein